MKFLLVMLLISSQAMALSPWLENLNDPLKQQQLDLRWSAYGGEVNIQFYYDLLEEMEVKVNGGQGDANKAWDLQNHHMTIKSLGGLDLQVPYGMLENITDGALSIDGNLTLNYAGKQHVFSQLTVVPAQRNKPRGEITVLDVLDQSGNRLFHLDHVHALIDHDKKQLVLKNMDVKGTPWLAKQLGIPYIEDQVIAQMHITTDLNVPAGGITDLEYIRGSSCANRPRWSTSVDPNGLDVDVTLLAMSAQYRRSVSGNRIVITPSATLKNSGINNADVPWHSKFSGSFAPHNNDQHPFLNWAMYREIDGRFEQIGRSGIKHAFLTINSNCSLNCGDSHILWPDCEDVYGVGTNDSGGTLGPREEVGAFNGSWRSTGSFFDPNGTGSQTNSSNSTDENRMVVDESKISSSSNQYYISAWYTIRDDIDIYNTMGHRRYNLTDNGSTWSVSSASGFSRGPASDVYVTPGTLDEINLEASKRIVTSQGHLTVAVKVSDEGNGTFRYNYMVENFDFDPRLNEYNIGLPDSNTFTNFVFADIDSDSNNDWTATHANGVLNIAAPVDNEQHWGKLFSFSFTTDAPPTPGILKLGSSSAANSEITASSLLVPTDTDIIFIDGFE
ncbi:hypothetical protein [Marinicella sp. W31]|uniref:hypothetical protein n=1 Tax=Marinicella sp. W31 TaxID=3023713 RepID=UPI003758184E